MHAALRPYATSGIAIVGAAVIAVSPILVAPPLPDVQVAHPSVALSATFEEAAVHFQQALQAAIAGELANPAPILTQVIQNQFDTISALLGTALTGTTALVGIAEAIPGLLPGVLELLVAGDVEGAVNALIFGLLDPALPLISEVLPTLTAVLQRPFAVAQALIGTAPELALTLVLAPVAVVVPVIQQFVDSGAALVDALGTFDLEVIATAVESAIADVAIVLTDVTLGEAGSLLSVTNFIRETVANAFAATPVAALLAAPAAAAPGNFAVGDVITGIVGAVVRVAQGFAQSGLRLATALIGAPVGLVAAGAALLTGDREQLSFLAGQFIDGAFWIADPIFFAFQDVLPAPIGGPPGGPGLVWDLRVRAIEFRDVIRNAVQGFINPQQMVANLTSGLRESVAGLTAGLGLAAPGALVPVAPDAAPDGAPDAVATGATRAEFTGKYATDTSQTGTLVSVNSGPAVGPSPGAEELTNDVDGMAPKIGLTDRGLLDPTEDPSPAGSEADQSDPAPGRTISERVEKARERVGNFFNRGAGKDRSASGDDGGGDSGRAGSVKRSGGAQGSD